MVREVITCFADIPRVVYHSADTVERQKLQSPTAQMTATVVEQGAGQPGEEAGYKPYGQESNHRDSIIPNRRCTGGAEIAQARRASSRCTSVAGGNVPHQVNSYRKVPFANGAVDGISVTLPSAPLVSLALPCSCTWKYLRNRTAGTSMSH